MIDVTRPPGLDSGFASPETQPDMMKEGGGAPPEAGAAGDAGAGEATINEFVVDSGTDARLDDAGVEAGNDAGNDAPQDTGTEAAPDSETPLGPRCLAGDGGFDFCNVDEHCCVNAPIHTASCATSCDSNAGLYAVDCPGATGPGGCGTQICCGAIVFNGGAVPNCIASQLTSACVDSCDAGAISPGSTGVCAGRFAIRYCTAAADCADDPNGNTACCNFGMPPSPVNWCVGPLSTAQLGANSCL